MIEIRGLFKQYGLNPVLRGLDLQIGSGEFVTLTGANGAGKSTLMRIVATLSKPGAGYVALGGWQLPTHADRVRRHIGLVSHHSLLYNDLSALENLLFFARLYQMENAEEVALAALRRVGLLARQRDPVRTFSRGMVQRLTIARATLHNPDILLLDEPYTGLDEQATRLLDDLLLRERKAGRTIFLITHDLLRGLTLADRVVILHGGRIVREVSRTEWTGEQFMQLYRETVGA